MREKAAWGLRRGSAGGRRPRYRIKRLTLTVVPSQAYEIVRMRADHATLIAAAGLIMSENFEIFFCFPFHLFMPVLSIFHPDCPLAISRTFGQFHKAFDFARILAGLDDDRHGLSSRVSLTQRMRESTAVTAARLMVGAWLVLQSGRRPPAISTIRAQQPSSRSSVFASPKFLR